MSDIKIEIDNFLKHENYYSGDVLINNPGIIPGQLEPKVSFIFDNEKPVEYSVIIPVHNQQDIIVDNIKSVITNMIGEFEMIIIFDNCEDNSEVNTINYFKNNDFTGYDLNRILIINQPSPIFETSCDNIGFRLSKGKYLLEIQSDIRIITFGFNFILSKPFRLYDDIISVSGRCAHTIMFSDVELNHDGFTYWIPLKVERGERPKRDIYAIGKMGDSVENPLSIDFKYINKFFILDTCNRGPMMFLNDKIKEIGYLDEQNFVLGDDEHDLNLRAKYLKNWICGYVPIEYYSPLKWGTSRKDKSKENIDFLNKRKLRSNGGFLSTIKNHNKSSLEIRDLDKIINYRNEKN
jgi:glycosyltransferase involved in cell wall biosynthesis